MITNRIGKVAIVFSVMMALMFGATGFAASAANAARLPSTPAASSATVAASGFQAAHIVTLDGYRPAGAADCLKAAGKGAGTLTLAVAAAKCGWGVSKWYANTSYYKNNWNRIINACWPNCSNAQILRAWLGLP